MINWLADAGSDDVFLGQTLRQMARGPLDDAAATGPGVLIVQLDGVAEPLLRWAVRAGNLPNLGHWLRTGSHAMRGWHTGMPATTPASQAGILHGDAGQVPAFRWYEKDTGRLVVTNRPRDAADVEPRHLDGRGLLRRRRREHQQRVLRRRADQPAHGQQRRAARPLGARLRGVHGQPVRLRPGAGARRRRDAQGAAPGPPAAPPQRATRGWPGPARSWRCGAVTNVLLRDLNVSLIAEQMARGAPVIFCDFVDYDEVAHHAGPARPEAMRTLEGLDRVLGMLHRLRREAARRYQIVVLSDHGQSQGATFRQRYGETLEEVVRAGARPGADGDPSADGGSTAEEWGRVNVLLTGMAHQRGVKGAAVRACAPEHAATRLGAGRPASAGPAGGHGGLRQPRDDLPDRAPATG